MRVFYLIIVTFLFLASCQQQQVKKPDALQNHTPLVIDYPAGVMITPQHKTSTPVNRNFTLAEKILLPHRIPVLDTNTMQMIFVKLNGDRISIAMDELAGKYDIILFNAISNPIPLRISDLQGAYKEMFNFQTEENITPKIKRIIEKNSIPQIETNITRSPKKWFSQLSNHDKRIIITSDDTSSQKFISRIIPGIQWVEQKVDTRTFLKINFENDLITYANTDRYFTNGVTIDLQAAWLSRSPLQKLMIPYHHKANVSYNLSMVQDMYTPTDTRIAPKLKKDRPYSSYLYFGFRKTTNDPLRKLRFTTQLDLGYVGPYSPGSYLQTLVHKTFPTNDVPLGWETQIKTDVIANYSIKIEKALIHKQNMSLLVGLDTKTGTLYNNAGADLHFQVGKSDPVFGLVENEKWPKSEYYFFAKTNIHYVAYNALLQGGAFNHDNIFTLKSDEIQHVVGSAEAGFHVRYKGVGLEVAQHYLSPEYKGGLWHKWGRMSLLFKL